MAIFEKQISNKISLDDTEKLTCAIENAHNIDKHTEYSIRVQRGCSKDNTWCVSRRYNDFVVLHVALQLADVALPLPAKKIIGNMQPGFIAARQIALQAYLNVIMKNNILASSLPVKTFLDPENYSTALSEMALQNVSMALRGDGDFELRSPLPNIGWRLRKHYYMVSRGPLKGPGSHVMAWSTYGPDKTLTERDLQVAFKSLMNLEHPYIDKIVFMHSLETGAYVVRNVHPSGSVRDHLHNTQFAAPYLTKYANPKQSRPFTTGQVAHYGYQILQALKYLHDRGLPYGHLHTGNLAIENQQVLLLDIENSLLGMPCYFRQFILEHKKINNMEAVDVFSFGHTIYEMAFGEPLNSSTCDNFPAYSTELVSVLQMILSSSACKHGLPTIDSLLLHPFFAYAPSVIHGELSELMKNCHLKFSVQTKEQLKIVAACVESRLKFDQKQVRADRRQLRIQEILSSEEELRKKKRKSKNKENAISHSQSSLNGFSPLSMSGPSERSGSAASTLSTASSPTPPQIQEESPASKAPPALSPSCSDPSRSAFLDSICSFNKNKLHKAAK